MARAWPLLLVCLVLAGCGGGGGGDALSASAYRDQLDAACHRIAQQNLHLPEVQRQRSLSLGQLRTVAAGYAREFRTTVEGLNPPASLASAHAALVQTLQGPTSTSLAGTRRRQLALEADYRRLGASGCVAETKASLRRLAAARRPPKPPN